MKRKECDYDTLHLGSDNSAEVVSESNINISSVNAIKEISTFAIQRENIFENVTRVTWNFNLLNVVIKVKQNISVLCVTKCFQMSVWNL